MRTLFYCAFGLAMVAGLGLASVAPSARAQESRSGARISDAAHMFDPLLLDDMTDRLQAASRSASVPILIETIDSLHGRTVKETALERARRSGGQGIYVLLAKTDRRIDVLVSDRFRDTVNESARQTIQDAFIDGLHNKGPDEGLRLGVAALRQTLARAPRNSDTRNSDQERRSDGDRPRNPGSGSPNSSLVLREQVRLTLGGARRIIEGAEAKAAELGLKMNIAVVDDGGHLLSFARMDGARPASAYTAITKATTAATFRQATGPLARDGAPPDPLLNLSLQNAAQASGGKLTTLLGGVPVVVQDQVIGGVGVGGGTGEQDAVVAKAGIAAFTASLSASERPREKLPTSTATPDQ